MSLQKYFKKRDFKKTPEPKGSVKRSGKSLSFVIQKHHASRLHYDFRLELGGTLKSWAVPKGPSLDPHEKRLAVEVEDHPIQYASFEGDIPKGEYGAGHVIVWDNGIWKAPENAEAALKKGHLDFELEGKKLRGKWTLIRLRDEKKGKHNWLLFKRDDKAARPGSDITEEKPNSVLTKKRPAKKAGKKRPSRVAPPDFVEPQLAQLVQMAPEGNEWFHEIKYDGYRTLCRIEGESRQLLTRSGLDWTDKYGPIGDDAMNLGVDTALLDGEIVWVNEEGYSDFQALQTSLQEKKFARLIYYVFDILFLDGRDLRELPLSERKKILEKLIKDSSCKKIRYSDHFETSGKELLKKMCSLNLEGIVSKRNDQPYESGRSRSWLKAKCSLRQEFVIGGYAVSDVAGKSFSSLLMGVYTKGKKLQYVGRVGTGFDAKTQSLVAKELKNKNIKRTPFDIHSPSESDIRWVKPVLVGEVEFKTWTGEGVMRHASFQGLRKDKKATAVILEVPKSNEKLKAGDARVDGIRVSHPDRIVYTKTKTKKLEIVKYYEAVADIMLPFMQDRPLSIVRCQSTSTKNCFFQKTLAGSQLVGIRSKPVQYKNKKGSSILADSKDELLHLVQGGALEIHGWGSQFSKIKNPDVIIFDLDPETPKLWPEVVDTAHEIRAMLKKLGLVSFVKVTGGKGVHVQAPIAPRYDWDQIKKFTKSLMEVLVSNEPDKYTTNMIKAKRKNRIFLDYLRNGYGSTAVLPYALRARERPTVALPISWKELTHSLSASEYEIEDVLKLLKKRKDPWQGYWDLDQKIKILEK